MACAVVLVPLTSHLLWATGSTSGLTATKIAERTSDFYALEAAYVLFAVMTVTGLLLIAFPRAGALPLRLPLFLAFVGSAPLTWWGGYLMLTALENRDPSRRISELTNVTYSMQLLAGLLVFIMGAYFFAERAAQQGRGAESVASSDSELHTVLTHESDLEAVLPGPPR
jgi:predicted membrane channel-forming protein YqfA (hemolysin III family)